MGIKSLSTSELPQFCATHGLHLLAPGKAGTEKMLGKDTKLVHFNEVKLQVRDAVSSWPWLHFDLPPRGPEPG